jgi:Family of unknown function (DUF6401)
MSFGSVFEQAPLNWLMREMGRAVFADMASSPGLVAAVDQHAAEVRDAIASVGDVLGLAALSRYLHGFVDGARERGWVPDLTGGYEWENVRLAAICWLAHRHGLRPA